MENNEFWNRIFKAAGKLSIPVATTRVWKSRGKVPRTKSIEIYEALLGTPDQLELSQLKKSGM